MVVWYIYIYIYIYRNVYRDKYRNIEWYKYRQIKILSEKRYKELDKWDRDREIERDREWVRGYI